MEDAKKAAGYVQCDGDVRRGGLAPGFP
jgi:hypothetical protein